MCAAAKSNVYRCKKQKCDTLCKIRFKLYFVQQCLSILQQCLSMLAGVAWWLAGVAWWVECSWAWTCMTQMLHLNCLLFAAALLPLYCVWQARGLAFCNHWLQFYIVFWFSGLFCACPFVLPRGFSGASQCASPLLTLCCCF